MTKCNEIKLLEEAMRSTNDKRLYERFLAVKLRLEGHTLPAIGKVIGRSRQAVGRYWAAYQKGGISGLNLKKSPGKPHKLTKEKQDQLASTIINKVPADVGFEAKYTWTLSLIASWIEREFNQSYTPKGVSKMLHRLGFSYTKATYTLANADPEEQRKFKEKTFPALKKSLKMA